MPPHYLANMIREGYPPGFVGIVGIDGEKDRKEDISSTVEDICPYIVMGKQLALKLKSSSAGSPQQPEAVPES
jgi:hypothetical protein